MRNFKTPGIHAFALLALSAGLCAFGQPSLENPGTALQIKDATNPKQLLANRARIPRQELESLVRVDPTTTSTTAGSQLMSAITNVETLSTTEPLAVYVKADETLRSAYADFRDYAKARAEREITKLEKQLSDLVTAGEFESKEYNAKKKNLETALEKFYNDEYAETIRVIQLGLVTSRKNGK